tara:strand:+ start:60 stop:530 length:471 start_codon:yes stop_codon:yes gene_type:complete
MSIFTDIKELANGKPQSKEWYREQVYYALDPYTGSFDPGDIIFFSYAAATPKLQFWDTFPMVVITDVDTKNLQFSGGNMHYVPPSTRKAIGNSWAAGGNGYPERCHHKYFMSNASGIYKVERDYLDNMTPLPIEQFVLRAAGRVMKVPSSAIWSRV